MSTIDQCPSTKKAGVEIETELRARDVSQATGKTYWRSLDDLANTKDFRDFLQREFPAHASELLDGTRRHFLKIMGASLALAGAATIPGCRRPDHRILAYNQKPEEIIEGKPLFYASVLPLPGGGVAPILAETFEGRPTKLEGNPAHPDAMGKSNARTQAAVLALYDPDRDPETLAKWIGVYGESGVKAPVATAWADFEKFVGSTLMPTHEADRGEGLTFLVEKSSSPSTARMRDAVLSKYPRANWIAWESADLDERAKGAQLAFGGPHRISHRFERADVVVSLDDDFLGGESATLGGSRGWSSNRLREGTGATTAKDTKMSRLYVAESMMTTTGGQADHRYPLRPAAIGVLAVRIAQAVLARFGGSDRLATVLASVTQAGADLKLDEAVEHDLAAIVEDLIAHRGVSIVTVGESQPAAIHALVHAINGALDNLGKTVVAMPLDEKDDVSVVSSESLNRLRSLPASSRRTLVIIGGNPVYSAPADVDVAGMISAAARSVYLGEGDETAAAVGVWLPRAHTLESWGDAVSWSGHYSVVQPMIAPLFGGKTELELLATIAGLEQKDPYYIVQETAKARLGVASFDASWRRLVQDGVAISATPRGNGATRVRSDAIVPALVEWAGAAAKDLDKVDLVFTACSKVWDGRFANNGWLQELPDAVTKVSWDNPALVSKATAERLGLKTSRKLEGPLYNMVQMVRITVSGGKSLDIPIWVQPGMPDNVIGLKLGYGRTVCGRVGLGTGFNANVLRLRESLRVGKAESIAPVRGAKPFMIANTQDHWSMEGRDIVRDVDLVQWQRFGDEDYSKHADGSYSKDAYGNKRTGANFAAQLGMESHTPINRDVYTEPGRRGGQRPYFAVGADGKPMLDQQGRPMGRLNSQGKPRQQWGMTIDLTKCSGCSACVMACQAENNIPIVGKIEVAKGREMHWIRVDRYYASEKMDDSAFANPDMVVQPIACVHCESAPCEVVCPVNATVHSDEGLNVMAYNRCIGTRYCSNNCPYKVRRFNYFDYATKAYKGGFGQLGEPLPNAALPKNQNLVPPRLREPIEEVRTMQYNPHVTVRSRGVMEKCTYCIQRINAARVETKINDLDFIPDGFFQTACQQACPADAIVFGDIYDYVSNDGAGSKVYQKQNSARGYALLAYLNTRPRTLHLLRVRNPNPSLVDAERKARWAHPPGHHGGHEGHGDHGHHDEHAKKGPGHLMSLPVLGSEHAAASPINSMVSSMAQGMTQGVLS